LAKIASNLRDANGNERELDASVALSRCAQLELRVLIAKKTPSRPHWFRLARPLPLVGLARKWRWGRDWLRPAAFTPCGAVLRTASASARRSNPRVLIPWKNG